MSRIKNIHDKFVRQLLSDKEMATEFLREYLPGELNGLIRFDTLRYLDTSYLSKELKASFSDMVWQAEIQSGHSLKICLLLEHKSYFDPKAAFQILEYLALAYRKQAGQKKQPELIVPILYYHGRQRWDFKPFESYFEAFPAVLKKYLPAYDTEFINLQQMSSEQIRGLKNGLLRSAVLLQKHYFDPVGLRQSIFQILESLNPYLESNLSDVIFVYLVHNEKLDHKKLKEHIEEFPSDLNSKIMSIYDQLIQEGRAKGLKEGIEKGIEAGIEKNIEKTILNAFDNGFDMNAIRIITGESGEKIRAVLLANNRLVKE